MITLKDSIEIKTPLEKIFDWFVDMDNERFTEWHPNHKKFVKITGGIEKGDAVYFEECVCGVWYKVRCKIIRIQKGENSWRVELKSLLARISFIVKATKDSCVFTHIETFGSKMPVIGDIVDFLLLKVFHFRTRFDLIQKDMEEDGKRLKEILEK